MFKLITTCLVLASLSSARIVRSDLVRIVNMATNETLRVTSIHKDIIATLELNQQPEDHFKLLSTDEESVLFQSLLDNDQPTYLSCQFVACIADTFPAEFRLQFGRHGGFRIATFDRLLLTVGRTQKGSVTIEEPDGSLFQEFEITRLESLFA